MAKKQFSSTYDEETLSAFQSLCEEYGVKANVVIEALMKYFNDGNCKLVIKKGGMQIEPAEKQN